MALSLDQAVEELDWAAHETILRNYEDKVFVWVTHDRRRMYLGEISTSHIRNAIAKIERENGTWRRKWLPILYDELVVRALAGTLNTSRSENGRQELGKGDGQEGQERQG